MEIQHKDITDKILRSFYKAYNKLGYGFLEKVYENALFIELVNTGLHCEKQKLVDVYYAERRVGLYFADIIVENTVIIELKAAESIIEEHEYQLINYLKTTEIEVGLLLNFGKTPQFKRKVFNNSMLSKASANEINPHKSVRSASSAFYNHAKTKELHQRRAH